MWEDKMEERPIPLMQQTKVFLHQQRKGLLVIDFVIPLCCRPSWTKNHPGWTAPESSAAGKGHGHQPR